ncbi:UDP-glucose 4-epimerase GalE [Pontibacillus sp. ALD_SL1]|uniref:UDP-glucose 4-epimerase GalE n=1 Tax=Pontibacillus sp. ALD_SL1 TaxID=2777185 RepID=UPI001A95C44E|nr:UDP-glucose 4-epimerase GalE [Pontibacillus sp. ALD_SL1]QSS99778.1 UDP-glucose 4-epimerase GalE [Pontibacillus sp. ALD_SL1]
MNILVTGGAGFIGSHTCISLLESGYSVIVADNFCNSESKILEKVMEITGKRVITYEIDVTNEEQVNSIFKNHQLEAVIHFAGYKAVGESVNKPLDYYYNNILSTLVIARACQMYSVNKIVFSSSATVYGDQNSPFVEDMNLLPTTNPYGETKAMSERILMDMCVSDSRFSVALLRYFNPVGAHSSGLIGEEPRGIPNNLMPYITKVAKGELENLNIFGDNYSTVDGTGVRDYIHVMDLAKGHVAALQNKKNGAHVYNLGTGYGTSVLEMVKAFEEVNNINIPYKIVDKRSGDIGVCYADVTKASRELNWEAQQNIRDMCRDAWRYEKYRSSVKV